MNTYMIYLPGLRGAGQAEFEAAGLGDLVNTGMPAVVGPVPGPDGATGCICAFGDVLQLPAVQYLPERQAWRESRPAGRYWLGMYNDVQCDPATLLRPKMYRGEDALLAERIWTIPICRLLPHVHGLDDNGRHMRRPRKEFTELCERSATAYQDILLHSPSKDDLQLTLADGFGYAVMALAVNYRVNADIVDFLGLLDDESLGRVIGATIEMELIRQVDSEKKNSERVDTSAT